MNSFSCDSMTKKVNCLFQASQKHHKRITKVGKAVLWKEE